MFKKRQLSAVVEASAMELANADKIVFIRRMMWRDLDERVERIFVDYLLSSETKIFGNYRLSRKKDYEPIRTSQLPGHAHLNSTHISSGIRSLGLNIEEKENEKSAKILSRAYERNC